MSFNRQFRLQILLQILALFVRNSISQRSDLYVSAGYITIYIRSNRKLQHHDVNGIFSPLD